MSEEDLTGEFLEVDLPASLANRRESENTETEEFLTSLEVLDKNEEEDLEMVHEMKVGDVDDLLDEYLVDLDDMIEKTERDMKMKAEWIEYETSNEEEISLAMLSATEKEEPVLSLEDFELPEIKSPKRTPVKPKKKKMKMKKRKRMTPKIRRMKRKYVLKRGNVFDRLYKPKYRKCPEFDKTQTCIMSETPSAYVSPYKQSSFRREGRSFPKFGSSTERLMYIKDQARRTPRHVGPGSYSLTISSFELNSSSDGGGGGEVSGESGESHRGLARDKYGFGSSSKRFHPFGKHHRGVEFIVERV